MEGKKIIDAVSPEAIERELTDARFLRRTNKADNEIYSVSASEAPATMREIGRLREIAFRQAGGGTGKECDIDRFDTMEPPCRQLIVWDPENRLILGGYRYICGPDIKMENGAPRIATSHMFSFSERFINEYLGSTIELGRSFVRPEYQSSKAGAKALYALDNLWDGLGALTVLHPDMKYLFGKVTMYPSYDRRCRDMILYYLHKHFGDSEKLVCPVNPLTIGTDIAELEAMFTGEDIKADHRILSSAVRARGQHIPPLVNAYMGLSPTMKMFGTAVNDEFGDVEETGIFFKISEIYDEKKERHVNTYLREEKK